MRVESAISVFRPSICALVVLQRRADGGLEGVDGDKVWEQRQHILYSYRPSASSRTSTTAGNPFLLHDILQDQLSVQNL